MNNKEWYAIGLDTSDFTRQAKQTRNEFTQIGNTAYKQGMRVDRSFQMIGKGALAYFGVQQLTQYTSAIINIRGEFQQLGIAFETMLDSKAKADKLMGEIVYFAQKTPFTLTDVATNVKQLMAMGIATENVMDTMKALGDVAAGVSVPISRVAVNYGQVATLGKLQQREIRDFAMAGIPLVEELAKNLGKTKTEITDLVSAGKVGFPEVEKAFQTMASEGGKFYNLMEKQNASVTGQISNLQDKIEVMMNEIGKSNEGVIYGGIEGASTLISNYEEIGKTILELVAVYGAYKTALFTISAVQKSTKTVQYTAEAAELTKLLTMEQQAVISKKGLIAGTVEHSAAVKAEMLAEMERQTLLAASVNTEIGTLQKKLVVKKAEKIAAMEAIAAKEAELAVMMRANPYAKTEVIRSQINTAQKKLNTAATAENAAAMQLNAKRAALDSAVRRANTVETGMNTAAKSANATTTNILAAAKLRLTAITARLNAALAANVYALAAIAIVGLAYGIYKLATAETAAEKAHRTYNDELERSKEAKENLISKTDELISKINSETQTIYAQLKAYKELQKQFPELFKDIDLDEFKAIPVKERKIKINIEVEKQELEKFESDYNNTLARITKLQERYDSISGVAFRNNAELVSISSKIDGEKELLKLQEQQLETAITIRNEAEFEAKPSSEKLDYYNTELESLKKQRAEIEETLSKSEEINGQWGKFGVQTIINTGELEQINTKIDETAGKIGKLTGQTPQVENKSYWEKQKKEAGEALDAMTAAQEGSKEWNENFAKLQQAQTQLKVWDYKGKLKENEEDTATKLLEAREEYAEANLDVERRMQASRIAIMKEGATKQTAEAELSLQNELDQIDQSEKALKESFEKLYGTTDFSKMTPEQATEMAGALESFNSQRENAEEKSSKKVEKINQDAADKVKATWDNVSDVFISDIEAEKKAIIEKYKILIERAKEAKLATDGLEKKQQAETDEVDIKASLAQLDFEEEIAVRKAEIESNSFEQTNATELKKIELFRRFTGERIELLEKSKAETAAGDIELLQAYLKELDKAEQQLIENIATSGASMLFGDLSKAADLMHEVADASGDIDLSEAADKLESITRNLNAANSGFQSGGWIGAIVGGASDILAQSMEAFSQSKIASAQLQAFYTNFNNALNIMALQVDKVDFESIFGTSGIALAVEAYSKGTDAITQYNEAISQTLTLEGVDPFGDKLEDTLRMLNAGYTALQGMLIKIKDRGWFGNDILGKDDKYTSLFDMAPELWGDTLDGAFDIDAAKAFLETNTQISEAQRDQIQNAIDLKEAYDESMAEVDGLLSDWLGSMATDMADSIWDSVVNGGEDAWSTWRDIGSDAIAAIGKQMIGELILGSYLKNYEKSLQDAFSSDSPGLVISNLIADMMDGLPGVYDMATDATTQFYDAMTGRGIDFDNAIKDQQSLTGISRNITEETGTIIAGIGYRIQGDLQSIENHTGHNYRLEAIDENTKQATDYLMQGIGLQQQIVDNTKATNTKLDGLGTKLDVMNSTLKTGLG